MSKRVVITGAARGIGGALADHLARRGDSVALVGLESDLLEERAARLGNAARAWECDVTDLDRLEVVLEEAAAWMGGIDVVVANAGIHTVGSVADAPVDAIERVLDVNLGGVWRTSRAAIPHLAESGGYLLNIASLAVAAHLPLMAPYAASKAGVEAFTNSLRSELRPRGVDVGCAYFGFIDTDLVRVSFQHPAVEVGLRSLPSPLRRPVPVTQAVHALVRAIDGRRARVWAPRGVGIALANRWVGQRILERGMRRDPSVAESLRLAAESEGGHPVLGISAPLGELSKTP